MNKTWIIKNIILKYLEISVQTLMNEIGSQKNPIYSAATIITLKNQPPSWITEATSPLGQISNIINAWKMKRAKVILKTAETPKHAVAYASISSSVS